MIWHMTYTHKLPKLCSATLKGCAFSSFLQSCKTDAPWLANTSFDPLYEENRLTTHDYTADLDIGK